MKALRSLLLTIAVLGMCATASAQTIKFATASGHADSTNFTEPFVVVIKFGSAYIPDKVEVTLSNGKGQTQTLPMTKVEGQYGVYVSQTITVQDGAQKTGTIGSHLPGNLSRSVDPVKVDNGGTMSVSYANAAGDGASTSITVYENASKQAIARNMETMDRRSRELTNVSATARDAIKKINERLAKATDENEKKKLRAILAELQNKKAIAEAQLATLGEGRRLMQDPPTDTAPAYMYTDQYKLAVSNAFLGASRDPNAGPRNWQQTLWKAQEIGKQQWNEKFLEFQINYALGLYEATASLSLAGPALTAIGGKTIYWKDATLGERLSAAKDLAIAFAMIKGLPKVVDILGEQIAGELGGYQGSVGFEIAIPGTGGGGNTSTFEAGGGAARAKAARGSGAPEAGGARAKAVFHGANEESGLESFSRTAEIAKAAGVPPEVVDAIVNETMANYEAAKGGEASLNALAEGEFNIAGEVFARVMPDAIVVTDVNLLEFVRTVRIKASLEASGSPQRWTTAEVNMLNDLATNPDWAKAFELEDPFFSHGQLGKTMAGLDQYSEPGYSSLLNDQDAGNIKVARSKQLTIDNTPDDPAITAKLKAFREKQAVKAKPKPAAQGAKALQPRPQTEMLKPGAVKNTQLARGAGDLKNAFDVRQLRDLIAAKRLRYGKQAEAFDKSPLSGKAPGWQPENLGPSDVKQLTPYEIRKITPAEIKRMNGMARAALPLDVLSEQQLLAYARAEGVTLPADIAANEAAAAFAAEAAGSRLGADRKSQQELADYGRALVEADEVSAAPALNWPASGSIRVDPSGKVEIWSWSGKAWVGAFNADGTIKIASTDGSGSQTLAPAPIGGLRTIPGVGTFGTFPQNPIQGYSLYPKTTWPGGPLGGGVPVAGPNDSNFVIPGRSVELVEEKLPNNKPTNTDTLDFIDGGVGPIADGPRDPGVQMFMGALPPIYIPIVAGASETLPWRSSRGMGIVADTTSRDELWIEPLNAQNGGAAGRRGVKAVFVSLGVATGEAFQVQIVNDGDRPINVLADGVVLEPIARDAQARVRKDMDAAIARRGAGAPAPTVARMSAYCMEYLKQPPAAGTLFRVASADLQTRFAPMRNVLRAAERLEQLGQLRPDSNPAEYFHSIRQWALWSKEQGFNADSFGKAFVDHARKNFAAAKQPWTKQIEAQIAGLVPHRWQEIQMVLREAETQVR